MEALRDRVTKRPRLRCRPEAEGRYLLYNPATDELHLIGDVEKSILDFCDGRTIDELVAAASPLLRGRGIEAPQAAGEEILRFLAALEKRGIVEYQ